MRVCVCVYVTLGAPVADEANAGQACPAAVAADEGLVWDLC